MGTPQETTVLDSTLVKIQGEKVIIPRRKSDNKIQIQEEKVIIARGKSDNHEFLKTPSNPCK